MPHIGQPGFGAKDIVGGWFPGRSPWSLLSCISITVSRVGGFPCSASSCRRTRFCHVSAAPRCRHIPPLQRSLPPLSHFVSTWMNIMTGENALSRCCTNSMTFGFFHGHPYFFFLSHLGQPGCNGGLQESHLSPSTNFERDIQR